MKSRANSSNNQELDATGYGTCVPPLGAHHSPPLGGIDKATSSGRGCLLAPRPFLIIGDVPGISQERHVLDLAVAVNRLLGFQHRVGVTGSQRRGFVRTNDEIICRFFQWWLQEEVRGGI
jgi:hypothetical protein